MHDLMEDRFDRFANTLQWNTYGVVVPKFGNPNYNSGYYGTMFDWGGWQVGDSYFRQGAAIAEDAIRGRTSGTLYDTDAKKDRLLQLIFCHEIGHSFNLPAHLAARRQRRLGLRIIHETMLGDIPAVPAARRPSGRTSDGSSTTSS